MGYPITVRDDHTLVLPQLAPINVYGMSLREVELVIADACRNAQLLQLSNTQIMVSLWRPREYRVMVVRQEATETTTAVGGQGTVSPGVSKRGSGQIVRLRAYENDVLHALTNSVGGNNGLPGLDAEKRDLHYSPQQVPLGQPRRFRRASGLLAASAVRSRAAGADQLSPRSAAVTPPPAPAYTQPAYAAPPQQAPLMAAPVQPVPQQALPQAPPAENPAPVPPAWTAPERIQYGTPQNGMPVIPQSYQVIRGQSPQSRSDRYRELFGGHSTSFAGHSTQARMEGHDVRTAEYGRRDAHTTSVEPVTNTYSQQTWPSPAEAQAPGGPWSGTAQPAYSGPDPYAPPQQYGGEQQYPQQWPGSQSSPGYGPSPEALPQAYGNAPPSWGMSAPASEPAYAPPAACPSRTPIQGLFPEQFNYDDLTIDSPNVTRIPIRLGPGESPNICEEDFTLYDGDIVFIESRESEVFYTGGLLGGGEYQLPRDRDLHLLEAVSIAQSRVGGGGGMGAMSSSGGVSSLNADVTVSPSRVIIIRGASKTVGSSRSKSTCIGHDSGRKKTSSFSHATS